MPRKPKRVEKTKEQMLAELRSNSIFITKMKFIREQFYPALIESSRSIAEASDILSGFTNNLMQEFLGLMQEKKMKELNLTSKLSPEDSNYEANKALVELFDDMSVFDAKSYIEGMKQEIETFKSDEMRERPLSSLKTKWLDEI